MSNKARTHYSGSVCYDGSGSTVHVSGGYAACCSGDRARRIRRAGTHTSDAGAVTCKLCLGILAKAVECRVHPDAYRV